MTYYNMIGVVILSCDQIFDFFHHGDREAAKNDVLLQKNVWLPELFLQLMQKLRHLLEYDRSCPIDVQ